MWRCQMRNLPRAAPSGSRARPTTIRAQSGNTRSLSVRRISGPLLTPARKQKAIATRISEPICAGRSHRRVLNAAFDYRLECRDTARVRDWHCGGATCAAAHPLWRGAAAARGGRTASPCWVLLGAGSLALERQPLCLDWWALDGRPAARPVDCRALALERQSLRVGAGPLGLM